MIYIEKKQNIEDIKEDIFKVIQDKQELWDSIPEGEISAVNSKIIRKEFFDQINKQKVRDSLYQEQHGLCAYCMLKLNNHPLHMTIEHFKPLSKNKNLAMDYENFLGVCKGGEDFKLENGEKRIICCDANKGDLDDMQLDPQNKEMMDFICYTSDGEIYFKENEYWDNKSMDDELTKILVLNGKRSKKDGSFECDTSTGLVKGRKDAFHDADDFVKKKIKDKTLSVELLEKKIAKILDAPVREQFDGVKLFVYKRACKRLKEKQNMK